MASEYFLGIFTSSFKVIESPEQVQSDPATNSKQEATAGVIEIHEDKPEHFEFVLKSLYTGAYDKGAIERLTGGDKTNHVTMAMGIHEVADKYSIINICEAAAADILELFKAATKDSSLLEGIIVTYYAPGP
jgi:hypothetical protein